MSPCIDDDGQVLVVGAKHELDDTLLEHLVFTVKGFEQRLLSAADALIGVAHHLRRDISLTVGYALAMPDDLRLDVVKRKVRFLHFPALAIDADALCVPTLICDAPLATELRHRPVDCIRPMMGKPRSSPCCRSHSATREMC